MWPSGKDGGRISLSRVPRSWTDSVQMKSSMTSSEECAQTLSLRRHFALDAMVFLVN